MDTYSGLALPATRASGGYFATKKGVDVAWGDLLLAIMCPIGGRFYNRSFGSGVSSAAFGPNDALLAEEMNRYIRDAAVRYVPRVKIMRVDITADSKVLNVTIAFSYAGTTMSRVTRIDRRSALQFISARSR